MNLIGLKKIVRNAVKSEILSIVDYDKNDYWVVQNGMYFDGDQLMLRLAKQHKQTYKVTNYKVVVLEEV